MFNGDTVSPPRVMGPPHPTPQSSGTRIAPVCTSWTTPDRASNRTSGSSLFGVGTLVARSGSGLAIDQTRRHLGTSDVDGQHDSG